MSTENTTHVKTGKSGLAKAIGLVSAAGVVTVIFVAAKATDHDSYAKGVLIGGAFAILVMGFLWWRGSRGGAAAHIANGSADERERRMVRDASADAAIAMMIAAIGGAVWSLFNAEAIAVLAVVMWSGLLTWIVSLAVRARRG